ncbi:putative toxin-antitoxin system toxin component, PIN family, partial [Candidatus Woesearchaeota archaeon]|nr:putative toxin-antitoxin system toxin component, PIN family [Candidatus Woesearchaeota archaeon]
SDDNKIIECAIDGNSDCIITKDKHLLKLKEYKGIKIITPEEFLK